MKSSSLLVLHRYELRSVVRKRSLKTKTLASRVDEDLQRIEEASAPSVGALSAGAPEATNQKRFENVREREIMVPMNLLQENDL